jgi:hypothetical protein
MSHAMTSPISSGSSEAADRVQGDDHVLDLTLDAALREQRRVDEAGTDRGAA